jgi:hypothetical protein
MKPQKIRVADIPPNVLIHRWVEQKLGLARYWDMPIRNMPHSYLRYEIAGFDLAACTQQADDICAAVGWHGFTSYTRQTMERSSTYGGFSVTYNPYRKDVSIYQSSLGDVKWNLGNVFASDEGVRFYKWLEDSRSIGEFYGIVARQGMEAARVWSEGKGFSLPKELWVDAGARKDVQMRNSYYETWRFSQLVPEMREGALGRLIASIKRPLVRSRCAYIRPGNAGLRDKEYLWHRDELVFVNFRLNIPLRSNDAFFLEDQEKGRYDFVPGYGYSWNTERMHRASWSEGASGDRSALVIGTNPWFDYVAEDDAYVTNEFFGEMHPFDMLAGGHIVELKSVAMA